MHEIVIKASEGQGLKTLLELISIAAVEENKEVIAFPDESFADCRVGHVRLAESPIRDFSPVIQAEVILVLDPNIPKCDLGLKRKGMMIVNTEKHKHYSFVDASSLAKELLVPLMPNTVMLGAFVKKTNLLKKESVEKAIRSLFPEPIASANIACFLEGWGKVS